MAFVFRNKVAPLPFVAFKGHDRELYKTAKPLVIAFFALRYEKWQEPGLARKNRQGELAGIALAQAQDNAVVVVRLLAIKVSPHHVFLPLLPVPALLPA